MSNEDLIYMERKLSDWINRINAGRVALPKFQRSYIWDMTKIKYLIDALLKNRPVGTLLLIPDNPERFLSRLIEGIDLDKETTDSRELVLDGQQRLTALWGAFLNDSPIIDSPIVVKIQNWDDDPLPLESALVLTLKDIGIHKKINKKITIDPATLYEKKCFPFSILGIDSVTQDNDAGWKWCNSAMGNDGEAARNLWGKINRIGEYLRGRGLWHLTLHANMSRKDAIDIYVKTNQSSAIIKKFDIAVAIYDSYQKQKTSLRDEIINMVEESVEAKTLIHRFFDPKRNNLIKELGELMFKVTCLKAELSPTEGNYTDQRVIGSLRNRKTDFLKGLVWALEFYTQEGILGRQFVPSDVPLRVLPALYPIAIKTKVNRKYTATVTRVIRSYLWRSFLTSRYSQNASTRLHEDYRNLKNALENPQLLQRHLNEKNMKNIAPIFNENNFPFPSFDYLSSLDNPLPNPKLKRTIARGVFAISLRRGRDFLTNEPIIKNLNSDWQYHHLFPKRYLKTHNIDSKQIDHCLNLSLITKDTNGLIGKEPPYKYLNPNSKLHIGTINNSGCELRELVETHVIPFDELSSEPKGNNSENPDVERIYREYIKARARMMEKVIKKLVNGGFT